MAVSSVKAHSLFPQRRLMACVLSEGSWPVSSVEAHGLVLSEGHGLCPQRRLMACVLSEGSWSVSLAKAHGLCPQ